MKGRKTQRWKIVERKETVPHWLDEQKEASVPNNSTKFTNSMKFDLGCKFTPLANITIPIYKNNNSDKK